MDDTVRTADHAPGIPRLYWLLGAAAVTATFGAFVWAVDRGVRAMHPCGL